TTLNVTIYLPVSPSFPASLEAAGLGDVVSRIFHLSSRHSLTSGRTLVLEMFFSSDIDFRTDSEDVILDSSASNECCVHCETMDKNPNIEYYMPEDPGLRNALQLSPEPDVVLSCWQTDSAFSFYNCMRKTSSDNGTGRPSHDAPRKQVINPIVEPSSVQSL
ncbi:hypothetical protein GGU11DRAFT_797973, partial [Lentinula aff. detonsa]